MGWLKKKKTCINKLKEDVIVPRDAKKKKKKNLPDFNNHSEWKVSVS